MGGARKSGRPHETAVGPPARDPPAHPVTPDGRYFVVRGRLWRLSNPALGDEARERLVRRLMRARRDIATARRTGDPELERRARRRVHSAKVALGERGTPWWEQDEAERRERWEADVARP